MQKVYSNQNPALVALARDRLQLAGIDCRILNEFASGGVGELSFIDSWPELWIDNPADLSQALSLLQAEPQANSGSWQCPQCQEINDNSFDFCWQCQHSAPAAP